MIPQQLIAHKRDGGALNEGQLRALLTAYLDGTVGDEQMAAFLMAVYFNGLTDAELDVLVDVMLHSGEVLSPDETGRPRVDKHSTGGVGDKVSLVLAPLAAELGMVVPMMSGRGLGHTGGTLDKLEAIPGFRTRISIERFNQVLRDVGCAMIGQTEEIAPLDRKLYALRDITGTVPSLPLITASIMSKKLAEALNGLVLDVKVGEGAFLVRPEDARALAQAMVRVGVAKGLKVTAVLSAMDRPLGRAIGHTLEVEEALACLRGGGPSDLRAICIELAAQMAFVGGLAMSAEEGRNQATSALDDGGALDRFARLVASQGGDVSFLDGDKLPQAPLDGVATAGQDGIVAGIDPRALGYSLIALGGGRTRQDDDLDHRVGIVLEVEVGERVSAGQPLAMVHAANEDKLAQGVKAVKQAITVADVSPSPLPLVLETVTG